jgi:tetratricopeptide (TPR) repeat protein
VCRLLIRIAAFAFLLASVSVHPLGAATVREISVGVAVTDNFKRDRHWKAEFERRLAYASKIFESECRVRFRVAAYWSWKPREETGEMGQLIEDLKGQFPLKDTDVVIGLAQVGPVGDPEKFRDLHTIGIAHPFSGYFLLRYPEVSLFKVQEETVLIHELGHLFGAVHTDRPDTVMSPLVERQIPTVFDPDNREILGLTRAIDFRRGMEALDLNDIRELLEAYLNYATQDQVFEFYYALGLFYVRLGEEENALRVWKEAVRLDDSNPHLHYDLGVLLFKLGDTSEALNELSKAVARFHDPGTQALKASALALMGAVYLQRGDYAAAYHAYSGARVLDPHNPDVQVNLAVVQLRSGQFEEALPALQRGLEREPRNSRILSNLAYGYFQTGRYQKAVDYLKQALDAAPQQTLQGNVGPLDASQPSEIYKNLGLAHLAMKNYVAAVQSFENSCHLNPTAECRRLLGEVYFQLGRWEDTIGALAGLIRAGEQDTDLYGMLGVALSQKGDNEQAVAVFQEGLRHAPDAKSAAALHKNIGNLYLQSSQWDLAEKEFRLAIDRYWNLAEAHLGLALAYLARERYGDARQSLKNALVINPNYEEAKELLQKVQSL